jgi:quercetin dioxygenase-like cupin family protein
MTATADLGTLFAVAAGLGSPTDGFMRRGKEITPMMKKMELSKTREFDPRTMKKFLLHDSPWFKIINFNLPAGHTFPVHSHDTEGQLSILVIEGEGEFLAAGDAAIPAKLGDMLISEIAEPHGVRAITDMRIIVTIAPPF